MQRARRPSPAGARVAWPLVAVAWALLVWWLLTFEPRGEGPLVVLSHGMGDRKEAFRFLAPMLVVAGYRVAVTDMRGHGESTMGEWKAISRTDVAGDLLQGRIGIREDPPDRHAEAIDATC